jgi:hypothetical protein
VQRRVYDALNVLHAMDIIKKDKNMIYYNPNNIHIMSGKKRSDKEIKASA